MTIKRSSLRLAPLACLFILSAPLVLPGPARADTLAFGVNNTLPGPDFFAVWTCNACNTFTEREVGWYFTPASSFDLSGLDTYFSSHVSGGDNLSRTVNIVVMTDRGVDGGTLLGETSFNSDDAIGQFGGADFSTPISLTGGTRYFVGFQNVASLGINTCLGSEACGVTVLPGAQDGDYSLQFANPFAPAGQETCDSLDCPALEFFQSSVSVTTPEPASLPLACLGFGGVLLLRKKRFLLEKGLADVIRP
jgi:hypothetical protein